GRPIATSLGQHPLHVLCDLSGAARSLPAARHCSHGHCRFSRCVPKPGRSTGAVAKDCLVETERTPRHRLTLPRNCSATQSADQREHASTTVCPERHPVTHGAPESTANSHKETTCNLPAANGFLQCNAEKLSS
ncbi:hypothetical protein TcCL_Unassigned06426, partial [Trypanosoma cruzi]